jgi:FtsH-binding integral membrane protein
MSTSLFSDLWDTFYNRDISSNANKTPPFSSVFKNFSLNSPLKRHLYNIYSTVALMLGSASIGAIATYNSPPNPWLWIIIQLAAVATFYFSSPFTHYFSINLQSALLYIISATTGILLTPLLHQAIDHDVMVLPIALIATTIVFLSLTIAAMKADRVSVLYYYSSFGMFFGILSFYSLVAMLFGTNLIPTMIYVVFGLIMTCFSIVLDTQNIIYKFEQHGSGSSHRGGENVMVEYKTDALLLFWNFMKLFVRILHLVMKLTKKDDKNSNNRRRNDSRR